MEDFRTQIRWNIFTTEAPMIVNEQKQSGKKYLTAVEGIWTDFAFSCPSLINKRCFKMSCVKKKKTSRNSTYHNHFVFIHGLVFAVSHQIVSLNTDKETERYWTHGVRKKTCVL